MTMQETGEYERKRFERSIVEVARPAKMFRHGELNPGLPRHSM
jgi:hypothetical protein